MKAIGACLPCEILISKHTPHGHGVACSSEGKKFKLLLDNKLLSDKALRNSITINVFNRFFHKIFQHLICQIKGINNEKVLKLLKCIRLTRMRANLKHLLCCVYYAFGSTPS